MLLAAGFERPEVEVVVDQAALAITAGLIERWFAPGSDYARLLAEELSPADLERTRAAFESLVGGPPRSWDTATAYVVARRNAVDGQ